MRDDKSFPYILVTGDHAAPQITKHRGARTRKGDYYGPFASVWAVNRTLNALERAFLLRSCTDSFYENRTRPCLLYQIKRCSGPCTGEIGHEDYAELVKEARGFLSGKSRTVRDMMAADMAKASEALEFERAARLRDRVAALSAIQGQQGINPRNTEEADVFAIIEQGGQFCIEVFFFRTYQNWGNRAYYPKADRSLTPAEVLEAFLAQFYDGRPPARLVLLSEPIENRELLEEAFQQTFGTRVEISTPQRGEKRDLVQAALHNAKQTLGQKMAETASQEKLLAAVSRGVRARAKAAPRRGLRQLSHHGAERRRRHGRRGHRRLHEDALPHLQHPRRGPNPWRRFRHDARGPAPPLHAPCQGVARRFRGLPSPLAGEGAGAAGG